MIDFGEFLENLSFAASRLYRPVRDARGRSLGAVSNNGLAIPDSILGGVKLRSNVLTMQRIGLLQTQALASGQFMSYLEEFAIPGDVVQVQIGVQNASPTAAPQIRCSLGFSEIAGNPAAALNTLTVGGVASSTAAAWTPQTRNGSSTPALIAMPGATVNKPFVTWFDPYPISSLPRTDAGRTFPVMKVIVEFGAYHSGLATATTITNQVAGVGISGWEQDTDLTAPPYGNFWRTRSQGVAAGVDPTTLTSTTVDNSATNYHAPIIVRLWMRSGKCLQVVMTGDSTNEASGDTLDKYGWIYRALHKLQSTGMPIGICNLAQAGTNPTNWADYSSAMLPHVPNSLVLVPNFSPNVAAPLGNAVSAATIVNGGSGGTAGAATLVGTTGAGTPFQIAATIGAGGSVTSLGAVTTPGNYTVLPTDIGNEPVTGGGLAGCVLSLTFIGANLTLAAQGIAKVKAIADQYGCGVVTTTCLASNTAGKDWKGSDPMRAEINAKTLASNEVVMDYAGALAGNLSGSQVQFSAGTTTDGLHPNATGHAYAEANVATPFFRKLTG